MPTFPLEFVKVTTEPWMEEPSCATIYAGGDGGSGGSCGTGGTGGTGGTASCLAANCADSGPCDGEGCFGCMCLDSQHCVA